MKKTILKSIAFATLCGLFLIATSCSGGKKEYSLKPKSTEIKGDLSDFFEVVDGTYKLVKEEGEYADYKIKVQLKRKDKEFDFDAKDLESRGYFQLCGSLLGEDGSPIILGSTEGMGVGGAQDGRKELTTMKSGDMQWVEFSYSASTKQEDMEKVKTFEINSSVRKDQQTSSSSSSTSDESVSSSSSDCDQFLAEYEEFADSYIKLLKKYKSNPSDPSILTEYTESAQKAVEMQTKAGECKDAKDASKLIKITNKLTQAAINLQ